MISHLNIDTTSPMLDYKLGIEDFNSYLPVEYYYAYAVLRRLQPAATDVICDVGCGKGRFLCIAARYPVRRVLGIELQRELCAAARENLVRLRGRRAPAEVICANCTELDFPDDVTIVFMFNPFGTETMISFLGRIGTSLRRKPRCFQSSTTTIAVPKCWPSVVGFTRMGYSALHLADGLASGLMLGIEFRPK